MGKENWRRLPELCQYFMKQDISAAHAVVQTDNYHNGVLTLHAKFQGFLFTPNVLFLSLTDEGEKDDETAIILKNQGNTALAPTFISLTGKYQA